MKVKNSLQVGLLPTGSMPRVLVSYNRTIMKIEEYNLVSRLITDLRSAGIDVQADEMQDINISPIAKLQSYDWILLIQTKDASSFALVQERLAQVRNQDGGHYLQGILHISVSASPAQTMRPASNMPNTFDAGSDYPRAFAGIVLKIHPDNQTHLYGIERGSATQAIAAPNSFSGVFTDLSLRSRRITERRQSIYILFSVLTVLILLAVIIIHSFTLSSTKTTNTRKTTSIHHTKPITMIAQAVTPQEALYVQVTSRRPVINDSLQSQSANQWDVMQQQGASCAFINGSYHVSILPPSQLSRRYACLAQGPVFANLALQVDLKLLQGDVGGIIFRANGLNAYSWFSLDARGCYRLVQLTAEGQIQILSNDQRSCLLINMQNTHQLTVLARSSNIYLYIDGKFMNQLPDPSLTTGGIGLVAIERTQPTDVAFTNLKVWQIA